jgi:hypothetical protein
MHKLQSVVVKRSFTDQGEMTPPVLPRQIEGSIKKKLHAL